MKKELLVKTLALSIVILFIGSGVFPTVSGSIENKYKKDISESSLQLSLADILLVAGLMNVINKTSEYLEVITILGFWIKKGLYGGFFQPNESLLIYGFRGYTLGRIVFGVCNNITRPS